MYPDYLAERDYYDSLLGKGKGDPDLLEPNARWIGMDEPVVTKTREVNQPREFGDNDPSDPFNIDLE